MNRKELFEQIIAKKSYLCIGLDVDISKVPAFLLQEKDPVFEFNRRIIDATHDLCVAYKPNTAFYESMGIKGWEALVKTVAHIPDGIFTIADAKRGDIGNTSAMYARTFFDPASSGLDFDSVTVAPYMGKDSVTPFLDFPGKWVILLALTSNIGSNDFQRLLLEDNSELYEQVLKISSGWGNSDQLMYVVGATRGDAFQKIRAIVPENFLLVPGIGAQGGDLKAVSQYGMNDHCGLLVNASRSIIYAGSDKDFAAQARKAAKQVQEEMESYLEAYLK